MEFDIILLSILFGLAGTIILFISPIKFFFSKMEKEEEYYLISQAIGFLFLLNSFLYLLFNKLEIIEISTWWYYLLFIIFGIYISVFMVKEIDTGSKKEIYVSAMKKWEYWVILVFLISSFILLISSDPLPFMNIVIFSFLIYKKNRLKNGRLF